MEYESELGDFPMELFKFPYHSRRPGIPTGQYAIFDTLPLNTISLGLHSTEGQGRLVCLISTPSKSIRVPCCAVIALFHATNSEYGRCVRAPCRPARCEGNGQPVWYSSRPQGISCIALACYCAALILSASMRVTHEIYIP
jgi:hypothetical protein